MPSHQMNCVTYYLVIVNYKMDPFEKIKQIEAELDSLLELKSRSQCQDGKCPKFGVIANLEVESVVNTFAVIIHLKLSHYGNDRLRKRV